jgi:DnaJ-domain-containing protein 1
MSDTPTPGERLDQLIGELRTKADDLRDALEVFGNEARDDFAAMIDALSAKIDEVQAAWDERRAAG